jgi:hypothetical protein
LIVGDDFGYAVGGLPFTAASIGLNFDEGALVTVGLGVGLAAMAAHGLVVSGVSDLKSA